PPVDVRALPPARRRLLRRDPGVERPVAVLDHPHKAGLAVRQDQLGLGQPTTFAKKALPPAIQVIAGGSLCPRCVVAGGFEAEPKRLVPTQVVEATPGDEFGLRYYAGRMRQRVPDAEDGEDGRLAVGRNLRAEAVLLLVDRLAESIADVHAHGPFRGRV